MKVVILQSNYLPWKGYFDLINDADVFCFYDEVKYTKNDWRNRNKIYTANGLQWLAIPIHKEAVKQKISEVELPADWQQKHFNKLKEVYSKAPFWNQLEMLMDELYFRNQFSFLSEFNQYSIKKISEWIGLKTVFLNSADFELKGDRVERLINLLKNIGATQYLTGPSAKDYLSNKEHLFAANNIELKYKVYGDYSVYKQLYQPFENHVSIVDLIANIETSQIKRYICS